MYFMGFAKPIKVHRVQALLFKNLLVSEEDTCKTNSDREHDMIKTIHTRKNTKYRENKVGITYTKF